MADRKEHPVLWGLVALVVVSGFLGLLVGAGTLAASRMAGLGGSGETASAGAGDTLFLPSPSPTTASSSGGATDTATESTKPKKRKDKKKDKQNKADRAISLTAGQTSVSAMQQVDLTGRYPGGDGAILQVQRLDGGTWVAFPVTTQVSGGSFSTYIQTGRPGPNKFRVADTAKGQVSNRVTVTIG